MNRTSAAKSAIPVLPLQPWGGKPSPPLKAWITLASYPPRPLPPIFLINKIAQENPWLIRKSLKSKEVPRGVLRGGLR